MVDRGKLNCATVRTSPLVTAVTRITGLGETGSWPTILADLDSLTETEIEPGGARFRLRSAL
jgi:hypothetical protein